MVSNREVRNSLSLSSVLEELTSYLGSRTDLSPNATPQPINGDNIYHCGNRPASGTFDVKARFLLDNPFLAEVRFLARGDEHQWGRPRISSEYVNTRTRTRTINAGENVQPAALRLSSVGIIGAEEQRQGKLLLYNGNTGYMCR